MNKPLTIQHILQQYKYTPKLANTTGALVALTNCRTAALGYHTYQCASSDCQQLKYQYHSCRNRHCPQCGSMQQQRWVHARKQELLPIPYFHVVFTMPHELHALCMGNRTQLYNILLKASARTLQVFAADAQYLQAQLGFISVLHTWGQQLSFHPHVHCIVGAGGVHKPKPTQQVRQAQHSRTISWRRMKRSGESFLFSVQQMSKVYRAIFLKLLSTALQKDELKITDATSIQATIKTLHAKDWVVYAKPPFAGPAQVLEYIGRYTHRVAINNSRLVKYEQQQVTLKYKDYKTNGTTKLLTLHAEEFLRRFEQHILPPGFCKIRSYGYLGNRSRATNIHRIRQALDLPQAPPLVHIPWHIMLLIHYAVDVRTCPHCKRNTMQCIAVTTPPAHNST